MRKYVFTVKDDVCAANGKDISAGELLAKMKLWGDVEDFDRAVASIKAEYQQAVDNLTAQLYAIKSQELTDDEIALINAYRECKDKICNKFNERVVELEATLQTVNAEHEKLSQGILALLNK